jgi:methylmalonyl-CoA/ethylmalonyl-CoA epimerase
MIHGIDHIGIAVPTLDEAISLYRDVLGLVPSAVEEVPSQQVRTVFFDLNGVHLELLEPTAPESPIARFLAKNGPGVHHIAFKTDSIEEQLSQAAHHGCRLINETPTAGANDKLVAFLHPKSTLGVLMELCEPRGIK